MRGPAEMQVPVHSAPGQTRKRMDHFTRRIPRGGGVGKCGSDRFQEVIQFGNARSPLQEAFFEI